MEFTHDDPRYSGIDKAIKTHMALKNDPNRTYHKLAVKYSIDIIKLFQEKFPGVEIDNLLLREKSGRSLVDKIKSLEIERSTKLACVNADIPGVLKEFEIDRLGEYKPIDYSLLNELLADRMDEIDDEVASNYYKYNISHVINNEINTSSDAEEMFRDVHDLFEDSRISKNSKTAIARIMYAKIKGSRKLPEEFKHAYLEKLSRKYGKKSEEIAIENATTDTMLDISSSNHLKYDDIRQIENSRYDTTNDIYDNTYTSKLARLIDEQEFLRAKDTQGMQIIIQNIPRNFKTDNPNLKKLLLLRNNEQDAVEYFNKTYDDLTTAEKAYLLFIDSNGDNSDKKADDDTISKIHKIINELYNENKISPIEYEISQKELKNGFQFEHGDYTQSEKYRNLDQKCMQEIGREFSDFVEQDSRDWLESHHHSKLVRDSIKHKAKPNGYIAEHGKIEMEGDPLYTLEFQVKSHYVYEETKPGHKADHSQRIGKDRRLPELVNNDQFAQIFENPKTVNVYMSTFAKSKNAINGFVEELDYLLPKFTSFNIPSKAPSQIDYVDFDTIENCVKFYEEKFALDHNTAKRLLLFVTYAKKYGFIQNEKYREEDNLDDGNIDIGE